VNKNDQAALMLEPKFDLAQISQRVANVFMALDGNSEDHQSTAAGSQQFSTASTGASGFFVPISLCQLLTAAKRFF
jgi:hypothetical protein